MEHAPFTVCYPVRLNDISIDAKIRSWVLFDCLQDAAGRHADQLGLGLKQLRHSDLSWVLSRIRLRMEDFSGVWRHPANHHLPQRFRPSVCLSPIRAELCCDRQTLRRCRQCMAHTDHQRFPSGLSAQVPERTSAMGGKYGDLLSAGNS